MNGVTEGSRALAVDAWLPLESTNSTTPAAIAAPPTPNPTAPSVRCDAASLSFDEIASLFAGSHGELGQRSSAFFCVEDDCSKNTVPSATPTTPTPKALYAPMRKPFVPPPVSAL